MGKSILSAGFNCVLHVHAATEEVTFAALLHKLEPKTGRKSKKPPPFAAKGQNIIARLQVTSGGGKVCVERFEDYPNLVDLLSETRAKQSLWARSRSSSSMTKSLCCLKNRS